MLDLLLIFRYCNELLLAIKCCINYLLNYRDYNHSRFVLVVGLLYEFLHIFDSIAKYCNILIFCNTSCDILIFCSKYCNTLIFCNTYYNTVIFCNTYCNTCYNTLIFFNTYYVILTYSSTYSYTLNISQNEMKQY